MWIPESLVRELDTPESRQDLAREATARARAAAPGADIEFFWDGMWMRRVGPHVFPAPDAFTVAEPRWDRWVYAADKYVRDADDYWCYVYKPKTGDVIVDIGAGRGEDVFAFSKAVGPEGRVWALEPHPISFAVLREFCVRNGLMNVELLNVACLAKPGPMQVETLPIWESNYVRDGERSATSYPVQGVRFDDVCAERGIDRIDFLKMNIEGAERMALPGCTGALQRAQYVCIAAHDFRADRGEGEHFRTLDFVKTTLRDAGFEIVTRDEDPRYYVPYHVHGRR